MLGVAAATRRQRRRLLGLGCLALTVLAIVAVAAAVDAGFDRRLSAGLTPTAPSLTDPTRPTFWRAALGMVHARPLLGVGPDNYRFRFVDYSGIDLSHAGIHAHNQLLEAAADSGLPGAAALVALWLCIGWTARERLRRASTATWPWRAALAAALVAWLLHALVDDFDRFWPTSVGFWLCVGLALGLGGDEAAQQGQEPLGRVALADEAADPGAQHLVPLFRSTAQRQDAALGVLRDQLGEHGRPQAGEVPVQ